MGSRKGLVWACLEKETAMDDILRNGVLSVISNYSKQTGLACIFCPTYNIPNDRAFCASTNCNLCSLIQTSPEGKAACDKQRKATVERSFEDYNYQIINCHAGLIEWVVPVYYQSKAVGYFVSGFVLSEEVNILKIEKRQNIFVNRFHLLPEDVDGALANQMVAAKENIVSLAELLFSLVKLNIPSGRTLKKEIRRDEISKANFVVDEEVDKVELSDSEPLSSYICSNSVNKKQLETFWKSVETKANDVFMNSMSGRFNKAHESFNEIMKLACYETDIKYMKTGVEMLFHIIYLKFYNKDLYDTRFYRLSFDTINNLNSAKTKEEIVSIMDEAFREIFTFFNIEDDKGERKTISPQIIKYLEENYSSDIKIGDIEKITYMTPTYASKLFKKETSFTIKTCLINIRMKRAQELLLQTDIPIKDIAAAVGYTDIRGFYKMFSQHFGITCSEMRENRIDGKQLAPSPENEDPIF